MLFVCDFYNLSAWWSFRFVVYIRRIIYTFLNVCRFDYTTVAGVRGGVRWEGWARKPVNHTSWMDLGIPTDRPKSVRNRCVIKLFGGVFLLSICPFDISVGLLS